MSVSDKVKQLYKSTNNSAIKKNYIMNIDGVDYDNTNIVFGSFNLTEKLCSSQQLKFGECNAAMLKVKVVADIGDISDKKINLKQEINDINIDMGVYNVDSCVLTENKKYRDVVAYDNMYLFNKDVSSWYNELEFPITIKNMLISLCDYIGVEPADVTLITGDKEIEKTISPEELKGITVLKSIAELNAGFFRASDVGKVELVTLNTSLIDDYLEVKDYKTLKTENYETNKITKLVIRTDKDDIGASAGDGDNAYIIEDNFLLYGSSTETIKEYADIIYEKIKDISYVPYTAEQIGLPYLRCGSQISYRLTSGDSFIGLVLQRTLSGTQGLKDVIKSSGTKSIGSTFGIEGDIIKIKNKVNTFKRTLEQTLSAVEDLERGFNSQIKQTSEELGLLVQKVANMGDTGVTEIVVKYAISDSATKAPAEDETGETTIWSSEAPKWIDGMYIWQKTVTAYNNGKVYETTPICITGATGATGADGLDGKDGADGSDGKGISDITNYYLASSSSSGVTISTAGWTTTVQTITSTNKYLWNYEQITYTDNTTDTTTPTIIGAYGNTGAAGADGKDGVDGAAGKDGADGKGIQSITEYYLASSSSSGVTTSTSGWTTTIQTTTTSKKYLWNYEVITYTDGSTDTTKVRIIGTHGATGAAGKDGENGSDGKGISKITNYYLASSSSSGVTTGTSGWTTNVQTITSSKKYLWNYEVITYTDDSTDTTTPTIIGAYGNTGATGAAGADGKDGADGANGKDGADGKGIKNITEYYLASSASSGVTTSTSGWTTTIQTTTTSKKYLWNYEVITYTDGSTDTTKVRIIGTHGATGATGAAGKDGADGADGKDGVGVEKIEEQYYQSTSSTTQTGGSWSTTVPTWVNGRYIWTRSIITYTDNSTKTTDPICVTGAKGATGASGSDGAAGVGVESVDVQYFLSTSSSSCKNGAWSTEAPEWVDGKYMWSKTVITYTDGTSKETNAVCITGAKGATGAAGTNGKGISNITNYYLASSSSSGISTSSSGWTTSIQTITSSKKYLWNYEIITYTDNSTDTTTPTIIGAYGNTGATGAAGADGKDGADGANGKDGADGKGIQSITEYYLASSSSSGVTTSTSGWTTTIQTTTTTKKYLWNYEVITYTDGSTSTSNVRIIGTHGATGATGAAGKDGADGKGIKSITEYYLASSASSGVTTSTSGWTTTIQTTTTTKKYLWNYEKITYTDGSTSTTTVRIIGTHGATGNGLESITEEYYLSTSKTEQTGGSWSTTAPTWSSGKYIWTRSKIVYTNGNTAYTKAVCDSSWEAVNDIEIGARNLLINSNYTENNKYTLTATESNYFKITDSKVALEQGQEYIFSCLTDGTWGEGVAGEDVDTVEAYLLLDGKYSTYFRLDNNIGFIFTAPATGTYYLRFDVNKNGVTHSFWNFQIERGNKKSDWKPAIEDVDGLIGQNVKSVDVKYYLSTSATTPTGGSWVTTAPTWVNGKYIWTKTVTVLANGESSETTPVCITGAKGETGAAGATGKGIKSITEYYLASASSSGVTTSTSGWTTTVQTTTTTKKYLWNYEKITYTDGSTSTTTVRIIGTHGATGAAGADGLTIENIVPQYYVSTSKTSLTGGSWSSTAPTWSKGKYVWTRSKITYSDNTVSYSTAVCDASWEVANTIEAKLELKVDKENLISELNAAADIIKLLANRLIIESTYFKLTAEGKAELAGGKIGSWNIGEALTSEAEAYVEPGEYERDRVYEYSLDNVTLTANELKYLDLNSDGSVNYKDILLIQKILLGVSDYKDYAGAVKSMVNVELNPTTPEKLINMSAVTPWEVTKEVYLGINGLKCPKVLSDAVTATTIETAAGVNLDTINSELTINKGFGTHTFTAGGGYGYVTTGATEIFFYIPLNYPKSAQEKVSVTVTALNPCYIRTVQGTYVGGFGSDLTAYVLNPITYYYQGLLRITLKNSDGWGVTNNTPVCGDVKITYTME